MKKILSTCILVKNEEKYLEDCLNSIMDISDEIIIIDNGSTDRSVSIAKKFGCRIFIDTNPNVDMIRNKFKQYSNCEWILSIDADERLQIIDKTVKKKLKNLSHQFKGVYIPRIDYVGKGMWAQNNFLRLYRNSEDVIYSDVKIHASIKQSIYRSNGKLCEMSSIVIHHFDSLLKNVSSKRNFYRKELLKQIKRDDIDNFERYSYLCFLGLEYIYLEKYKYALLYFDKAISLDLKNRVTAYVFKAQLLVKSAKYEEIFYFLEKIRINNFKYKNIKLKMFFNLKKFEECKSIINEMLTIYPNYSYLYLNLSYILYLENNEEYIKYIIKAKEKNPYINNSLIYKTQCKNIFEIQNVCFDYDDYFKNQMMYLKV